MSCLQVIFSQFKVICFVGLCHAQALCVFYKKYGLNTANYSTIPCYLVLGLVVPQARPTLLSAIFTVSCIFDYYIAVWPLSKVICIKFKTPLSTLLTLKFDCLARSKLPLFLLSLDSSPSPLLCLKSSFTLLLLS